MFNPIKLLTSKRGINFKNINGYKLIQSERLQGANGERIKLLSSLKSDDGRVVLSSDLYDSNGVLKAYNTFNIDDSNKVLNGYWMLVLDPLEKQKHGYGEVLRLASIIDLMENNLKKIAIFSWNEAILFHYKYKFRPVLSGKDECMDVLNEISYEKNPLLAEVKDKAIKTLNKAIFSGLFKSPKNIESEATSILDEYLSQIQKNHIPWRFNPLGDRVSLRDDISMELDRDSVIKNKEFFNKLFKKHGFDYTI